MPNIHIKSRPLSPKQRAEINAGIASKTAEIAKAALDHVNILFYDLNPGYYSVGGVLNESEKPDPADRIYVTVELYSGRTEEQKRQLQTLFRNVLSKETGVPVDRIGVLFFDLVQGVNYVL